MQLPRVLRAAIVWTETMSWVCAIATGMVCSCCRHCDININMDSKGIGRTDTMSTYSICGMSIVFSCCSWTL